MKAPFMIGRALFGGYFLYSGIKNLMHSEEIAGYASAKNVPMPDLAAQVSGVALALGGASILLGVKPKLGAAALVGFLAAASPAIHNFWAAETPEQRQNDLMHFTMNLALAGGALALAGVEEPWPMSVPWHRQPKLKRVVRSAWRALGA